MDIEVSLKESLIEVFKSLGLELSNTDVIIERSKDKAHGDYATNAALKFSSRLGKKPFEVANQVVTSFKNENVDHLEVAGPGFINFFIKEASLQNVIKQVLAQKEHYGDGEKKETKINLEYVSANPTGLLHIGHARGAAYGDSLARVLMKAGYPVFREYYVNDAGNQVNNLAKSIFVRYQNLFGQNIELGEDMYHGEEIIEIAKEMKEKYGETLLNKENVIDFLREEGIRILLSKIREDLDYYRISHDGYTYETDIRKNNAIEKQIEVLKPYTYEEDGGLILKTTAFLDDKDRPIRKGNGDYTYFMPDICYHINKLSRGYDLLIDVLGADHHGYMNRMKSALMMNGYKPECLEFNLVQMVRIFDNGEEIKLSKRSGRTLTIRELCDEVGVDAARYFMVSRDISSHIDFNMALAREQSSSNPVYYAQYAHARLASVLESAKDIGIDESGELLSAKEETALMKQLIEFPNAVNDAAKNREPSLLTNYIQKLAQLIHAFYTECRCIDKDNIPMTKCRLALASASKIVMANALDLIGVTAPNKM